MRSVETRAFGELELRSDGRTLTGLAVPFDTPARIDSITEGRFTERFARGAFTRTIAQRGHKIPLLAAHDAKRWPLGKLTQLTETRAGLEITARISDTVAGNEALALIRDGALTGLSVGFRPVRDTWSADRSARTVTEAALHEVSVTAFPAYDSARVAGVRHAGTVDELEELRRRILAGPNTERHHR